MVNGETGAQMIEWAKKAMETNSLLVILFHGVGGGNALNVSIAAHREFLRYLKNNEKDIWIAPMLNVAEHIKNRMRNKFFYYSNNSYLCIGKCLLNHTAMTA
jgi:sialate O-acetylesterase